MKNDSRSIVNAVADVLSQAIATTGTLVGLALIFYPELLARVLSKKK